MGFYLITILWGVERLLGILQVILALCSQKNLSFSEFPGNLRPLGDEPYFETGAGIENIFKVFRIYAIWRLTHLNDFETSDVTKFGIFASVYFSF